MDTEHYKRTAARLRAMQHDNEALTAAWLDKTDEATIAEFRETSALVAAVAAAWEGEVARYERVVRLLRAPCRARACRGCGEKIVPRTDDDITCVAALVQGSPLEGSQKAIDSMVASLRPLCQLCFYEWFLELRRFGTWLAEGRAEHEDDE
jgi:hypothetical protein